MPKTRKISPKTPATNTVTLPVDVLQLPEGAELVSVRLEAGRILAECAGLASDLAAHVHRSERRGEAVQRITFHQPHPTPPPPVSGETGDNPE